MPLTYSINIGQITESTRKSNIFDVLEDIPNNTQKLIKPRDVRDAFLSTWANSTFKITTGSTYSNIEYIGIDSGNPNDRDVKQKILLGKRSFGNLDIMNNTLLSNTGADIFLYNTKSDNISQDSTKVAILSGTNSILHNLAPYLESKVNSTYTKLDLNIVNPSDGDINLYSNVGRVSINGIIFPSNIETSTVSEGKILKYHGVYPAGKLKWGDSTFSLSNIGVPGTPTNIYGSPVLLNNQPLEFVDNNIVPNDIGGIKNGDSFSSNSFTYSIGSGSSSTVINQDWPLVEILRKILYPYIEPVLQLSATNTLTNTSYFEARQTSNIKFDWSITSYARDFNESITDFVFNESSNSPINNIIKYGGPYFDIPGSSTQSSFMYSTYSDVGTMNFDMCVSTYVGITSSGFPFGYSFTASQIVRFINPIFYGYNNNIVTNGSTLQTVSPLLSKLIEPYKGISQSYEVSFNGSGYLYFIYPSSFTSGIKYIYDPNGYLIYDYNAHSLYSFTYSSISSPIINPDYAGSFIVWRSTILSSYVGFDKFKFQF